MKSTSFQSQVALTVLILLLPASQSVARTQMHLDNTLNSSQASPNNFGENLSVDHGKHLELAGQLGGAIFDLAIEGDYAYFGEGSRLMIKELSDLPNPVAVGTGPYLPEIISGIEISGGYAYVAGKTGLWVLDVSDPTRPFKVGFVSILSDCCDTLSDIAVSGDYVFLAGGSAGLIVIDVKDPTNPKKISVYPPADAIWGVAVSGRYAYVAAGTGGFEVVDVSAPLHPYKIGYTNVQAIAREVDVREGFAYVATSAGMSVVAVSNPAKPLVLGSFGTLNGSSGVTSIGDYAYLAEIVCSGEPVCEGDVWIVDVGNPADPIGVGFYDSPVQIHAMAISGSFALLAGEWLVAKMDVSDPANPFVSDTYDSFGRTSQVALGESFAYIASGSRMGVVDISDPANPVVAGHFEASGLFSELQVSENYIHLVDKQFDPLDPAIYHARIRVLDVSEPTYPIEVGSYQAAGDITSMESAGGYVYFTERVWSPEEERFFLRILDVSDPANPREVGSREMPGDITALAVSGGYVYVTDRIQIDYGHQFGLRVVDVTDPANPTEVGYLDGLESNNAMEVASGFAYLAGWTFTILDVQDPANPLPVNTLETPWFMQDISIKDEYAYLASFEDGLRVMDISDPANPREAGVFDTPGYAFDLAVNDDLVGIADFEGGCLLLRVIPGFNIGGQVTDWDGAPLSNVQLSAGPSLFTTSNYNGNYLFNVITGTYTLTIDMPDYQFLPSLRVVSVPPDAPDQDFTVSPEPIYSLNGRIEPQPYPSSPVPLEGIEVTLNTGETTFANATGEFSFTELYPGDYTVTPELHGYAFWPVSQSVRVPSSSQEMTFEGFAVSQRETLAISGRVLQPNGLPCPGVPIVINASMTATTDLEGRYVFPEQAPGLYILEPAMMGFAFLPESQVITLPTNVQPYFTILPAPMATTLSPGMTTTMVLTDPQGLTTQLQFPSNSVNVTTTLILAPTLAVPPGGLAFGGHAFQLVAYQEGANVPEFVFGSAVTVTVSLSPGDVGVISNLSELSLWFHSEGGWTPSGGDLEGDIFRVSISQTGFYALFGPTRQLSLPLTPGYF